MILGFKSRFEAPCLAKTKRHTIRAKRKGKFRWRPGVICHCYVNSRQKGMRLFARWPCVKVQDIRIFHVKMAGGRLIPAVSIDDQLLKRDEREALARSDGFSSFAEMMDFWRGRLPFHGDIIHWDPEAPVAEKLKRRKHA